VEKSRRPMSRPASATVHLSGGASASCSASPILSVGLVKRCGVQSVSVSQPLQQRDCKAALRGREEYCNQRRMTVDWHEH